MTSALTRRLGPDVLLRPLRTNDAASFCEAQWRSREQLAPYEPRRDAQWYDPDFQAARIAELLERDNTVPWVLADGERVIGTVTLSNIVLGPWRNADLGYWVDVAEVGRGLATAAVTEVCAIADEILLLHRIAASTNHDNTRSQRVLLKCGFQQYGFAPRYLHIDGQWRDSNLYQRILNDREPGQPPA
ncbi:GCN5-related N-acetyltransferase [Kribbella flavida DSM 17836]|uniref:GCN5-related N-acetyltransferase n=1 Tax=Kribbella flavida (strain DSM 17836 / JCM 10339 / NBRC 14399) TaxID=479435 RepID=D2PLW8_KRIFD|nr:GNAT family protein [Kribbella flavida]ADB32548.1 GCN5-related N-acetyltransferase [Kribbella flavida DSM 17836]